MGRIFPVVRAIVGAAASVVAPVVAPVVALAAASRRCFSRAAFPLALSSRRLSLSLISWCSRSVTRVSAAVGSAMEFSSDAATLASRAASCARSAICRAFSMASSFSPAEPPAVRSSESKNCSSAFAVRAIISSSSALRRESEGTYATLDLWFLRPAAEQPTAPCPAALLRGVSSLLAAAAAAVAGGAAPLLPFAPPCEAALLVVARGAIFPSN
mmetsp:Transcript_15285/g.31701  ORF Transcript_15285/g.31701 Transcript_15285/m.31701 type:complete len:214 (+) Transcript_15285:1234-1875(+)